ncbi:MAG: hypothetical protein IJV77_05720 [Clostridia bacterium]|nr:hypothetical protein [Clostridia bacterium]
MGLSKIRYSWIVIAIALLFSVSGVFAAWVYAEGIISPVDTTLDIELFEWLPGMGDDSTEQDQAGTNHATLIQAVVDTEGDKNDASLNNSKSAISKTLGNLLAGNSSGELDGKDTIQGGHIKKVFPEVGTGNMGLILQFKQKDENGVLQLINDGNTYYMFTFETTDWPSNSSAVAEHVGQNTEVWRTAINKEGSLWVQGSSEKGYAPKMRYDGGNTLTIDHTLWVKGEIPK